MAGILGTGCAREVGDITATVAGGRFLAWWPGFDGVVTVAALQCLWSPNRGDGRERRCPLTSAAKECGTVLRGPVVLNELDQSQQRRWHRPTSCPPPTATRPVSPASETPDTLCTMTRERLRDLAFIAVIAIVVVWAGLAVAAKVLDCSDLGGHPGGLRPALGMSPA